MHISDDEWKEFYKGGTDSEKILVHTAQCDYCAARMAEFIPQEKIIKPMPYLSDRIIKESVKYRTYNTLSKRFEFAFYCARVGLAMCFALVILFSNNFSRLSETKTAGVNAEAGQPSDEREESITRTIWNAAGGLSDALNYFCNNIGNIKFDLESEDNGDENAEK